MSYTGVFEPACPQLQKPAQSQWGRVTSLFAAPWVLEALDRIADLSRLPRNWDGYGSPPIDIRAVAAARRFVASVAFDSLPFPHIAPVLGGSAGLHWRCGNRELEFRCFPCPLDKTIPQSATIRLCGEPFPTLTSAPETTAPNARSLGRS